MSKNDMVKVTICGRELLLTSGDDPEYIIKIAKKVDSSISKLIIVLLLYFTFLSLLKVID